MTVTEATGKPFAFGGLSILPWYESAGCAYLGSMHAGTLLHQPRTDLREWLRAIWLPHRTITRAMSRGGRGLLPGTRSSSTESPVVGRAHLRLIGDAGAKILTGELLPWVHIVTSDFKRRRLDVFPGISATPGCPTSTSSAAGSTAAAHGSTTFTVSRTGASRTRRRPRSPS